MSGAARFFWICAATATLCFVGLAVLSKPALEPGGLIIFDSHLFGYTVQQARDYLTALEGTPAAKALYLREFRMLDTVFPVLLSVSLSGALWLNAKGLHPVVRLFLLLVPGAYLVMDMAENAMVAQMLQAGPLVLEATIEQASAFTQSKWALLLVSVLLCLWAWRYAPKVRARRPR